jgi:UrcA family protein
MYINAQSIKESVARIKNAGRARAIRIAWVMFASASVNCMANAAPDEPVVAHKVVSFKDLNMNSAEGVGVLYKRINSAAAEVCGKADVYNLGQVSSIQKCIHESVARAIGQVNSPMLTSLYEAKNAKAGKGQIKLAQAR